MNARSAFPGRDGALAPRWPAAPRPALPRIELPVHDARHLTGTTGQAQIVLDGQVYALRITRAGKLILTK
jgi:hemin uptake protein HemP